MEYVILVDSEDQELGVMEKLEAHKKGFLHRAFSVILFNSSGEMLIQQRSLSKYHSPGLWTNACCSHPLPEENVLNAANRRLNEELGLSTVLTKLFSFQYKENVDNELTENELDHVFFGYVNESPKLNSDEVMDYRWINWFDLQNEIQKYPEKFTVWFKIILTLHEDKIKNKLCYESL